MDNVRSFVFVVMREILSVTPRLLVLMRLGLFFSGVPNFSPRAEILEPAFLAARARGTHTHTHHRTSRARVRVFCMRMQYQCI